MTGECGAFSCLLRFSSDCRCSGGGCDPVSCAYPVAAKNIKDSANTLAASLLIAILAEGAEVAGTTTRRIAIDCTSLDIAKLLKRLPLNDRR